MQEDKRLGFIGVVINDRAVAGEVNATLGQYARVIRARVGVPDAETAAAVIGLIVEGSNQDLGALTAKLGNLRGVEVKSALSKRAAPATPNNPRIEERTVRHDFSKYS